MKDVDALMSSYGVDREIAEDVEIFYSDSAVVRIKITAPKLVRYLNKNQPNEEFPEGLVVEFYNVHKQPYSWLKADYGMRDVLKKQIITRKNVLMYNRKNEKILTSELIWDETEEILFTEKFVKIIQPATQDTTTGFGFETNQEFSRFEIKRKGSASLSMEQIKEDFKK
jgi:LPS export ABC transporter protein LptC